jgi:predicted ATPase/DNA-binding CsgD family transcriptional regulator
MRFGMQSLTSHRHNLPAQVSSFIGRERELAEIASALRRNRLVTLTGPGGTGKTRLALQAVAPAADGDEFAGGVWLVELASLTAPEFVDGAIARAVNAPETGERQPLEALAAFLGEKRLLLVIDNCEHLLAECARVVAFLLGHCHALVVLATSREPLALPGESVLRVAPLGLPETTQSSDPTQLLDFDGIRLFVERAQAAEPSFRFSDVTAPSVLEICRQLDGIPLALELAAVRVRGMGVAYLGDRLDDRFRLLRTHDQTGEPRQRTLLALVDWSYGLLAEHEQVVLRRLAVFVGGFSAEAAESVCAGDYIGADGREMLSADIALDDLTRLVDKSLAQLDQETGRYRLLETIRLFGRDRLGEASEADHVNRQHFAYYLQFVTESATHLGGPSQQSWFTRLEQEHDNMRAALGWAIASGRVDEAAMMALDLWKFWQARTYQREGVRWLERIEALDAIHPLPTALRPRLFNALGVLAANIHQFDHAKSYQTEALRLWTEAGDRAGMTQAQVDFTWQYFDTANLAEARRSADEAVALAEDFGDERLIASALCIRSAVHLNLGTLEEVVPALERSMATWRRLGDMESVATTTALLGQTFLLQSDFERAKPLLAEALRLHMRAGNSDSLIAILVSLFVLSSNIIEQPEQARDAARVHGVMLAWEDLTTESPSPWWSSELARGLFRRMHAHLDQAAFEQAVAEGKQLTAAGLLALADRITAPKKSNGITPASDVESPPYGELTPREIEVLRLVAQGMTNAQIANELTITPRTVNAHLTAIYGKLGVTSRGGAIRYALQHHLGE